jgi:hypothetical protein
MRISDFMILNFRFLLLLLCLTLICPNCSSAQYGNSKGLASMSWDSGRQGGQIMSLARDAAGDVWAGTEDHGVWMFSVSDSKWRHFTAADGLGDDCAYALSCDKLNRIWVGTLRHGVSIFNGLRWKNYPVGRGPIGNRVYSLVTSPIDGDVWIATNCGISRYSQTKDVWSNFTTADGLSSNSVNSLAFDSLGNLYVGTLSDGICISFLKGDYKKWRCVKALPSPATSFSGVGLPSNKINGIAVGADCAVYVATSHGLAWSSDSGVTWRFVHGRDWISQTKQADVQLQRDVASVCAIDLLPADNGSSPKGSGSRVTIECGTDPASGPAADRYYSGGTQASTTIPVSLEGVANAAPSFVYQHCRTGNDFSYLIPNLKKNTSYAIHLHFSSANSGKKTHRGFAVDVNGAVALGNFSPYVSGENGKNQAIVKDIGATSDGDGKLKISFHGAEFTDAYETGQPMLGEDYVTCVCLDSIGRLWVGHQGSGVECLSVSTMLRDNAKDNTGSSDYAQTLLPFGPGGSVLTGWYDGGLSISACPGEFGTTPIQQNKAVPAIDSGFAALPSQARPPTCADLQRMLQELSSVPSSPPDLATPFVVPLDDDWNTEGDWLGRYGRYWACLSAIATPYDYLWGAGWDSIDYDVVQSIKFQKNDYTRSYITWLSTENPRVLEMPPIYRDSSITDGFNPANQPRREAELDDHGETYPRYLEGPNLYDTVTVPAGTFIMSTYCFNKDGTDGNNRCRDYTLSIRQHPNTLKLTDINGFGSWPELAHGRIYQFRGGVWKRFLVSGPTELTIEVNRDFSFNTLLTALTLDLPDEEPAPYFMSDDMWISNQIQKKSLAQNKQVGPPVFGKTADAAALAGAVYNDLLSVKITNPGWWAANKTRYFLALYTFYSGIRDRLLPKQASQALIQHTGTCAYELALYPEWESDQADRHLTSARSIEESLTWDKVTRGYIDKDGYTSGEGAGLGNQYVSVYVRTQKALATLK